MRSMSSSDIFAFARTFSVTSTGPVSMIAGSEPILANALMRIRGFFARLLAADQHGSGTVDNAGRIAGMVHVVDRLELGMCLYRDRIKPTHLAELHEGRIELRQGLHGGTGPHVFILGEDGEPIHILDRNHRARETALVPRSRRAPLALHGIGVDVIAGETVFSRD